MSIWQTYNLKLDHYIDHRIREMLPSNATVETPATTTYIMKSSKNENF